MGRREGKDVYGVRMCTDGKCLPNIRDVLGFIPSTAYMKYGGVCLKL